VVGIDVSQLTACHWLLLRLPGTAPNGLISQCRRWLGQGRALDLGRAVDGAAAFRALAATQQPGQRIWTYGA
jgi:hypothetical protein